MGRGGYVTAGASTKKGCEDSQSSSSSCFCCFEGAKRLSKPAERRVTIADSRESSPISDGRHSRSSRYVASKRNSVAHTGPQLPEPLNGAARVETATLDDVPTADVLAQWLRSRGLETCDWGKGDTKDVSKYWKELKLDEAGLEVWQTKDDKLHPVRVTHVLRAKVCSESSYEKGIFLFNTWQQYGDGRKRTRNGLLSEKLTLSEMPLEENLMDVCQRAVTEEEMQRVIEAAFKITDGCPAPEYDPNYVCPLEVVDANFVEHTIEIETSKSYPGLLTMYHLYTVDIVCTGLPATDFNTLEFDHPDKAGKRKLKYVHAWVWLQWSQIQRYLYEGSTLKEKKGKCSFSTPIALEQWLGQFDLDLDNWGNAPYKSVKDLHSELEKEKAQLELWGRHDGVPLLMRVVHVLNVKVVSTDPRLSGKLLFQMWQQSKDGNVRTINRLLSQKLSIADLPFDHDRFAKAAERAVTDKLMALVDRHFSFKDMEVPDGLGDSGVRIARICFLDHRIDIEDSPSFLGLHTMYHLYTMEVECDGLPAADFTSIDRAGPDCNGWHWGTWQETMDMLHARAQATQRRRGEQEKAVEGISRTVEDLRTTLWALRSREEKERAEELIYALEEKLTDLRDELRGMASGSCDQAGLASVLPPNMISKMSERMIVSERFLDEAYLSRTGSLKTG